MSTAPVSAGTEMQELSTELVTLAARHTVRWDATAEYEDMQAELAATLSSNPEFRGLELLNNPFDESKANDYITLLRFESVEAMETQWLRSDLRKEFVARVAPLLINGVAQVGLVPQRLAAQHSTVYRDLFGDALIHVGSKRQALPPALYKTATLTLFGLYASSLVALVTLGDLLARARVDPFALALSTGFVTYIGNIYVTTPFVSFIFASWLARPSVWAVSRAKGKWQAAWRKVLVNGFSTTRSIVIFTGLYFLALLLCLFLAT